MMDNSELDRVLSQCLSEEVPIKLINYRGLSVPDTYPVIADSIENFEVRDDDVWVCGFPRTGTTWTQEMVWNIANDLDFERAAREPLFARFAFLEFTGTTTSGWVSIRNPMGREFLDPFAKSVETASKLASPRFLKTHLPFHLLPRQLRTGKTNCKIVYVTRNPKDTCISYFHHYKLFEAYCGTFENFCQLFLGDKVYYAPFWSNVLEFCSRKDHKNLLFLKFEDLKADLPSVIRKTANFLGKNLSDEQVKSLEEHLSFERMKYNPSVNLSLAVEAVNAAKIFGQNFTAEGEFIRKGETDQWKTVMTQDIIKQFDDWTETNLKNFKFSDDFNFQ